MAHPADIAARLATSQAAAGPGYEELRGFAVMSLPFSSGDVLGLRSWPASSFGPAFNSVWHCSPAGEWTVYHSAPADVSCPRYVGAALTRAIQTPVGVEWTGPHQLRVDVASAAFSWEIALGATMVTRAMNVMLALMPTSILQKDAVLAMMSDVSTRMFAAGRVPMRGLFPNRQWFKAQPRHVWIVRSSRAALGGRDFGRPAPLPRQPMIGSLPLPQKGVFMAGGVIAEPWSAERHLPALTRAR